MFIFYFSDMTFTNEGNKTHFDGLVNFEKMVNIYFNWLFYLRNANNMPHFFPIR